jgi:hypothetical protein
MSISPSGLMLKRPLFTSIAVASVLKKMAKMMLRRATGIAYFFAAKSRA